tara:strand:+ start:5818 stop:6165 length:348 start_codon:yes stop_codon:yes gene_type:complete
MNEREEAVFRRIVEREAVELDEATRFEMMVYDQHLENACFFLERVERQGLSILEGNADQHFNLLNYADDAVNRVTEDLMVGYGLSESRAQLAKRFCRMRMRERVKSEVSIEDMLD